MIGTPMTPGVPTVADPAEPTSYDAVPFHTRPLPDTHPDALATLAALMGMSPAPVENCRVLEIGCGTGGNLTPMAATLPGSRFVGLDLSSVQVGLAETTARGLGLTNVEYKAGSILDLDDTLGTFDYVLCHGVYSWVPPAVQDKILSICDRHLAPHGVAFVSYNTYPGWHLRSVARDAMAFLARGADTPEDQVRAGRSYLKFLAASALDPDGPYGRLLKQEAEILNGVQDYYVFHEHLESDNRPVYFAEFAARAAGHGLQYLGESVPHRLLSGLPDHVQEALKHISPDLIHLEQHVDYLRGRAFRRTLLCRADVAWTGPPGRTGWPGCGRRPRRSRSPTPRTWGRKWARSSRPRPPPWSPTARR
jgi:SAM-dependent methyltransferase